MGLAVPPLSGSGYFQVTVRFSEPVKWPSGPLRSATTLQAAYGPLMLKSATLVNITAAGNAEGDDAVMDAATEYSMWLISRPGVTAVVAVLGTMLVDVAGNACAGMKVLEVRTWAVCTSLLKHSCTARTRTVLYSNLT